MALLTLFSGSAGAPLAEGDGVAEGGAGGLPGRE